MTPTTIDAIPFTNLTTEQEGALIARHVLPHPHEPGRANAYLAPGGPSVAAVIRSLRADGGKIGATASSWQITDEAVRAAIAYYRRHRAVIDARLLLEDDAWDAEDA